MKKIIYFADLGQVKHKTPLEETGYISIYFFYFFIFYILFFIYFFFIFYYFFECLGIQFFSSLTCDLRDTMALQRLLKLLPREGEDFPRDGNHSKHMPPLTYLAWLQPIYYNSRFVFIHINITKVLLMVKTLIFFPGSVFENKIVKQISNHTNQSATMKT